MKIIILGTESLGVRGLSCKVTTKDRSILIDPGLALGYQRHGLLPHPVQVAVGEKVRESILDHLGNATDIVLSHFHGDHIPLPDANPFQLSVDQAAPEMRKTRIWAKGTSGLSGNMLHRRESLINILGMELDNAENVKDGNLSFSPPMPHGLPKSRLGMVMMTKIQDEGQTFIHASDIQLLNGQAIDWILAAEPDIVFAAGPPIYLPQIFAKLKNIAWNNAKKLSEHIPLVILDHHLMRSIDGLSWLSLKPDKAGHRILCAADFMDKPRMLLEATREQLYEDIPVPKDWHNHYAQGAATTEEYQKYIEDYQNISYFN